MAQSRPLTKGSQNYVWFLDQQLGRGAMGYVLIARHRKKGTKCAVKVFNPEIKMMPKDYTQIELDILRYLPSHEFIVKLIAVEQETYSKDKVVIMELCEGGSLQSILEQPEYYYGLQEEDFLQVFEHVGRALEHLYNHRVVHRDIKPGNILQCITADGRHLYKLTDFGAAKRLDTDDEGFTTLCGTEEYLHPRMHYAAFMHRTPGQTYDHTVDLWSFAVTIFQCATGKLPFSPKEGPRQNKRKMHDLMTKRESGVISQTENFDGSLVILREIPQYSQLTSGTKAHISGVLAHLLDTENTQNPKDFFWELDNFSSKKKIYVFASEQKSLITVYVKPSNTLMHVQDEIASQTCIPSNAQILLFEDASLEAIISEQENDRVANFPDTSPEEPIYLIAAKECSDQLPQDFLPTIPDLSRDSDMTADAKWGKEACGAIWFLRRLCSTTILVQKHLVNVRKAMNCQLIEKCQTIEFCLDRLSVEQKILGSIFTIFKPQITRHNTDHVMLDCLNQIDNLRIEWNSVKLRYDSVCEMKNSWKPYVRRQMTLACVSEERCQERCKKFLKDATPMYEMLQDDKKKEMNHNDLEIHRFHKSELRRVVHRALNLVENHCIREQKQTVYDDTINVLRKMKKFQSQLVSLVQDLEHLMRKQRNSSQNFIDAFKQYHEKLLSASSICDTCKQAAQKEESFYEITKNPNFCQTRRGDKSNEDEIPEHKKSSESDSAYHRSRQCARVPPFQHRSTDVTDGQVTARSPSDVENWQSHDTVTHVTDALGSTHMTDGANNFLINQDSQSRTQNMGQSEYHGDMNGQASKEFASSGPRNANNTASRDQYIGRGMNPTEDINFSQPSGPPQRNNQDTAFRDKYTGRGVNPMEDINYSQGSGLRDRNDQDAAFRDTYTSRGVEPVDANHSQPSGPTDRNDQDAAFRNQYTGRGVNHTDTNHSQPSRTGVVKNSTKSTHQPKTEVTLHRKRLRRKDDIQNLLNQVEEVSHMVSYLQEALGQNTALVKKLINDPLPKTSH